MPDKTYGSILNEWANERKQPNAGYPERLKKAQRLNAIGQIMTLVSQGVTGAAGATINPLVDKVTPYTLEEFSKLRQQELMRGEKDDGLKLNALYSDMEAGKKKEQDDLNYKRRQQEVKDERENQNKYRRTPQEEEDYEKRMEKNRHDNDMKSIWARSLTSRTTGPAEKETFPENSFRWIAQDPKKINEFFATAVESPEYNHMLTPDELDTIKMLKREGKELSEADKLSIIRRVHHLMFPDMYEQPTPEPTKAPAQNWFEQQLGTLRTPLGFRPGIDPLPNQQKAAPKQTFDAKDPERAKAVNDAVNQANMILESTDKPEKKKAAFYDTFRKAGLPEEAINNLWNKANQ